MAVFGASVQWADRGLVFATARGTPLGAQNIGNRHFKPLLNRADLPSVRWHNLRHTCATLLLGRGVHPKLVQHLGGHTSIQLTLDSYSHWMPSMGRDTATAMDEALEGDVAITDEASGRGVWVSSGVTLVLRFA